MSYLDDFCDHTLTFLRQNVVYVIVAKETNGRVQLVVEPRDPPMACDNIAAGVANGIVAGGVYKLRSKRDTDPRGLNAYFCGYEQNKTIALTLGNDVDWMFTVTMDGCTFGVGSQVPGGAVRVAHANNGKMANPDIKLGGLSGREAQRRAQEILVTSHIGPDGMLIEPDSYMGNDFSLKATTFAFRLPAQTWTFKSLSYRLGQGSALHAGINDYP